MLGGIAASAGESRLEAKVAATWDQILARVHSEVGETRFNLWFRNSVAVSCEDGVLTVGVPSAFMAEWLETHYRKLLSSAAGAELRRAVAVKFKVDGALFRDKRREETSARQELIDEGASSRSSDFESRRFTLETFVVGPCNSVAYAAARKVVEAPGKAYNPLFLHGGVGLGKTHLLVAIANSISRGRGAVEYLSAEAFTNKFLFALRNRSLDAFRARYRHARLLVIDDVHFLSNKPATQDEFLSTFNTLSREGAQIVMASDSHPKLIGKIKETLATRFLAGMVARLDKPNYATRLEIVARKAAERGIPLPVEVAEFVARNLKNSVREIEGAVNTLAAYSVLAKCRLDLPTASEVLKGLIESGSRPVRLPEIEAVVSAYGGIAEGQLRSASRSRSVSHARHLAMYLARELGGFSYGEIGNYFGGRNHSSVLPAVRKIAQLVRTDPEFAREIGALKSEFAP